MSDDAVESKAPPLRVPVVEVPVRHSILAPETDGGEEEALEAGAADGEERPSVVPQPVRVVSDAPPPPRANGGEETDPEPPLELTPDADLDAAPVSHSAIPPPAPAAAQYLPAAAAPEAPEAAEERMAELPPAPAVAEPPAEPAAEASPEMGDVDPAPDPGDSAVAQPETLDLSAEDLEAGDIAEPLDLSQATVEPLPPRGPTSQGSRSPSSVEPPPPPAERASQAQPPPAPGAATAVDPVELEVADEDGEEEGRPVVIDLTQESERPASGDAQAPQAEESEPPPPPAGRPSRQTPPPPLGAGPGPSGAAHRVADLKPSSPRKHHWWEVFFDDDYLRSVRMPGREAIARKTDFIVERLGLAAGATVLDVGCGWGVEVVELTARGFLGVGLDLSLAMLSRAADEAQERGQRINFLHADMREMNFDGTFDAVTCLGTTFGYFDDETNRQVVGRLRRALKPQGVLLLETVNRDHVIRSQPNLVWFEGDGCVCMEESEFNYFTSRLHVKRTVILDDGKQRENEYSVRLYSLHELGQMLHQQGFRVTEVSGRLAVPGVFFGQESPQMLVVAERRPNGAGKPSAPPTSDEIELEEAPEPDDELA